MLLRGLRLTNVSVRWKGGTYGCAVLRPFSLLCKLRDRSVGYIGRSGYVQVLDWSKRLASGASVDCKNGREGHDGLGRSRSAFDPPLYGI